MTTAMSSEPTTPTGKSEARAARDRLANSMYMRWEHPDIVEVILAIEQEAAAAERERLRQFHKRDPHHDARYCRWCARLEDPSDD